MRGKANNDAILRCKIRQELQKHIRSCQHKKFSPHIVRVTEILHCHYHMNIFDKFNTIKFQIKINNAIIESVAKAKWLTNTYV